MADEQDVFNDLDALPQAVRDFVLSPKVAEANERIIQAFILKAKEEEYLMDVEYKVFFKKISFAEFQNSIKSLAEAGKYSVASMQKMVTEELLLPINDYLGGEPKRLLENPRPTFRALKVAGGPVIQNKPTPSVITREPLSRPEEKIERKLSTASYSPPTKPTESKLAGFAAPRKKLQAESTPKLTTDWLHSERSKKLEPKSVLQATSPDGKAIEDPRRSRDYKLQANTKHLTDVEERELKSIKEKVVDLPRPSQGSEELVTQVLAAVQFPFKDETQRARFINAVKNRVRDIRDQFETQELLLRSENLGGVGLAEPVAEQASSVIEKIVGEQNRRQTSAKKEELQILKAQNQTAYAEKIEARAEKKLAEQDVRYQNLVKGKLKGALLRPLGFLKKKEIPTVEVPEIVMSNHSSFTKAKMLDEKEAVKINAPLSRPKMEDIKFVPTLVGPIEELKNFSLKDWQALGAKASVISQKLAVLRNEAYLKYISGLAAFRVSPLFALSQEILFESLEKNMPLAGLIDMRKRENRPYLSQAEINDILSIE